MIRKILALVALAFSLTACQPQTPPRDPCAPHGCQVAPLPDPEPVYVPQCQDVDAGVGPCVGTVGDSGMWIYVTAGLTWPRGQLINLCPGEDGGPGPCAWVPSAQGNGQGDSGAYVWGVEPVPGFGSGPVPE